jgi:death-on-curing protein
LPSDEVKFLTLDEVFFLHEELAKAFGGAKGLRDAGLLESALYRPRTGYYEDLIEMAAALFESLLMNRAFVDGNKRIAFFGVDTFLRINGFRIEVPADEAHKFLIDMLEQHTVSKEKLERFLRKQVHPAVD